MERPYNGCFPISDTQAEIRVRVPVFRLSYDRRCRKTTKRMIIGMIDLVGLAPVRVCWQLGKLDVKSLFFNKLAVCHAKRRLAKWQTRSG
jgi:hypothetical protein